MKVELYNKLSGLGFRPNTIVDCGCAIGEWTWMIRGCFPFSKIISIDASKWTDNIPQADLYLTEVLGDINGRELPFYLKKENLENGTFCTGDSLFKENSYHYLEHNTIINYVKTKTLQTVLDENNINQIDLLKIDTQGSEIMIMKGLGENLKNVEFIELECSVIEYNIGGCMLHDVVEFLKNDFDIFDIVELHRHNGFLSQVDVIFKNKNSRIKSI